MADEQQSQGSGEQAAEGQTPAEHAGEGAQPRTVDEQAGQPGPAEQAGQPEAATDEHTASRDAGPPVAAADAADAEGATGAAGEHAVHEPERGQREGRGHGPSAPRPKPEAPGAHLEVDIVPEGVDPLGRGEPEDPYAIGLEDEEEEGAEGDGEEGTADEGPEAPQPIVSAAIDLAAGARYRATGKRKTAVARVIVRPGKGAYTINGRPLAEYFPRATLQRNICQPLEAVGYEDRMDVSARLHGGGVASQAGALRHGIARALLEADPNLRGELKRRGFLTRDARVKERKKAGLKKARKRPQFSKR